MSRHLACVLLTLEANKFLSSPTQGNNDGDTRDNAAKVVLQHMRSFLVSSSRHRCLQASIQPPVVMKPSRSRCN
ncbi:hypothetical protein K456DRAFT_47699 [Colletotrichum gloeosporioides 23]|nr:hypothetical protein K456DRAFT_47699 [Colletotrichum gloeosporioides 23]